MRSVWTQWFYGRSLGDAHSRGSLVCLYSTPVAPGLQERSLPQDSRALRPVSACMPGSLPCQLQAGTAGGAWLVRGLLFLLGPPQWPPQCPRFGLHAASPSTVLPAARHCLLVSACSGFRVTSPLLLPQALYGFVSVSFCRTLMFSGTHIFWYSRNACIHPVLWSACCWPCDSCWERKLGGCALEG